MTLQSWWDYAEYHHEPDLDHVDRDISFKEQRCVARIMRGDHSGENRFYVAPSQGARWFAWGDWHGRVEGAVIAARATVVSEAANDATYTFADGGAYFQTREEAVAAIYRWIQRDVALELEALTGRGSL
jgi:hypothetical protein